MTTNHDFIAVFDSGLGGISVLRQLRKLMPNERYLYFGDAANAPYGTRPTEEVRGLTLSVVEKLLSENSIKALVIACNTATAAAVKDLREKYPELIVIGIEPAVKLAADRFPGGRIGVMATEVTLREEKFDRLIGRLDENCTVVKIPAPGLVELIESDRRDTDETIAFLRQLLAPYIGALDALVLGCTHYPFVKHNIQSVMGPGTVVVHGGEGTARETKRRLEAEGLLSDGSVPGCVVLQSSLDTAEYRRLAKRLLNA